MSGTASRKHILRRATPTVSTSAYADLDQVGGVMTFTDAFAGGPRSGVIVSLAVLLESGAFPAMTVHFFNASPTLTSSDNAALDIADTEMASKYCGSIHVRNTADVYYMTLNSSSVAYTNLKFAQVVESTDGNLYGVAQAAGAITFAATDDLTIILGVEAD